MRKKKGLIIDPKDICYEEDVEEIGFQSPGDIKGNLIEGFAFTDEPVTFAKPSSPTPEKPNIEKTKHKNNSPDILDMRKLSVVNGLAPLIDGEKLQYKRCYMLRFSTLKKLEQIKAMHPEIVYMSSLVDIAINHYYDCISNNK